MRDPRLSLTELELIETAAIAAAASAEPTATPPPSRPRRVRPVARRRPLASGPMRPSPTPVMAAAPAAPPPTSAPTPAPNPAPVADTQSELRDWIKDNAQLLSQTSLLISIAALALGLLPGDGWIEPYIQALLFGAALLLLFELHNQWPEDLQMHRMRSVAVPTNHSWRMSGFAFFMQLATILFIVWATLTNPLILFPLTAMVVVLLFRRFIFSRFSGPAARVLSILSLVLVLLLSEVLMLIAWAKISGEHVTIQLWASDRTGLHGTLDVADKVNDPTSIPATPNLP